MNIMDRISETYLVPVVVLEEEAWALDAANALLAGGVDVMEITLRTKAGLSSIAKVVQNLPDMLVGAGSVLTLEQCKQTLDAGARFVVSPGYNAEIVKYCQELGVAVLPGCVTPTEIMEASAAGLNVLKFFPANIYGGMKAINALRGPFPQIRYVPTGGVSLSNLSEFVSPAVFAIGGGWLCDAKAIVKGDYASITEVCKQSVQLVKELRNN